MNDLKITYLVDQSPEVVFDAVNNVTGWWIKNIDGNSQNLNDEFAVQFWDVHYSKQKLVEVIPGKKVVWLVIDSQLNFLTDKSEWTGTKIIFEVAKEGNQTRVTFIHEGLHPEIECYKDCSNAWSGYINNSLHNLITTGEGNPTVIEA